jgi:tetratricopeptide (TPR) repeat protein
MKLRIGFFAVLLLIAAAIFAAAPHRAADSAPPDSPAFDSVPADKSIEAARQNNLGVAYMNQQLFEKALHSFEAAGKLDPAMRIAKLNRAIALLNLQKVDDARTALEAAVKEDPNDPHGWYNLGLFYKNTSDVDGAIDSFKHVVALVPDDADSWYFLGTTYAQAKQYPAAIESFQHALKLSPLHASAEFGLSRAYQQSGDPATARQHLVKFQYIKENKLGSPMSLSYGEQGQYSRAEESPAVTEKVLPQIAVKFVDVTREAGLLSRPTALRGLSRVETTSFLGPGACFLDYDGDGKIDLFLADDGPQGGIALYHNLGAGMFEDTTLRAGLDPKMSALGCTAGDYDNDGFEDLALTMQDRVKLYRNQRDGTFKDVGRSVGFPDSLAGYAYGLTFVDYDHDGDLDLYESGASANCNLRADFASVPLAHEPDDRTKTQRETPPEGLAPGLCSAGNIMWRNNGDGTFTRVEAETGLVGENAGLNAVGSDINNDRAVDLVTSQVLLNPIVYQNPREGKFIPLKKRGDAKTGGAYGINVLDFDHDGWMDIAFTQSGEPGIVLWRNLKGLSFEGVPLPATNLALAYGVTAFDYDNDGWVDLVAVGETKEGKGEIKLFRNLGPDGWKDVTADVGLDKIELKRPRAVIVGDYDNDGANDLLITQNHGPAVLLRNEGGNKNNWLRLALKGLNDNKSAIGTKVEIFAGATRQKFEIYGSSGYLGQNSPYLTVGLGQNKQADVVRMLWPTGVLQDEIEVAGNREVPYLEIDRRGSSCPTLFVWNGERYELVGDMIGAGVVGHWVGPNERNVPRPAEYIKVDRDAFHLKDGKLSFHLTEPMEEAVYLDQVKAIAVDHPASFDVYPNEYFASNPPFPEFRVIESKGATLPASLRDEHGHDMLPSLRAHKYFGDFEVLPFHGFTKTHSLELDLGAPYAGGPLTLLMHGVTEYYTATSVYAAHQAKVEAISPYIEAQNARGEWSKVIDDMGFPAGGPRMITATLTDKLPKGTQKIRITTNLQVYWDSILIDRAPQTGAVELHEIPLQSANLSFHGFPRMTEGEPRGNVHFVYEEVSQTGPYARQAGTYTRYGDVQPLLTNFDDKFVVFGAGDDIAMDFDPSQLPALPSGWARDYFFLVNGYEKDMDFYAAEGFTVEPLPFQKMGSYPYPGKSYPLDDDHLNYLLNYNTRHVSGNEPRGYWYEYPGLK